MHKVHWHSWAAPHNASLFQYFSPCLPAVALVYDNRARTHHLVDKQQGVGAQAASSLQHNILLLVTVFSLAHLHPAIPSQASP